MVTNNAINLGQSGVVSYDGVGDFTGSTLTQHYALVAGASNAITSVTPSTSGFVLTSNGTGADPSFKSTIALTPLVVNPTAGAGNYTTISAAMAAATSGQDIFVTVGTYTENVTLTPGVNITAFGCDGSQDGTGHVTIVGKVTMTGAGACTLYGLQLETNSDYCIEVTGSNACSLNLTNCYINCSNNTGINFTNSNSSSFISMQECNGDVGTTGIAIYSSSSAGTIYINGTYFTNTGLSTTANSNSAGILVIHYSQLNNPLSVSVPGGVGITNSIIDCGVVNSTAITTSGSGGTGAAQNSFIASGTASTISVGSGSLFGAFNCIINSSNTNAITGAGAIVYGNCNFGGTSRNVNAGTIQATSASGVIGSIPGTGALGEQIRSYVASGSAVSVPNGTATNITSITLSPGTWDVSCNATFTTAGALTGSGMQAGISTTSATVGTLGDSMAGSSVFPVASAADVSLTVPSYRIFITTSTPVYMVGYAVYSVGSLSGYGRISATRVG